MSIFFKEQALLLLYAFVVGVVICLYFDAFRIIRIAFRHPDFLVLIEDILFSIGALIITLSYFSNHTNGSVRAYLMSGIISGFIVCHISVSKLIILQAKIIIKFLEILFTPIAFIINKFCKYFKKIILFLKKLFIFSAKQVIINKKYCRLRKRGGKTGGKSKIKRHKHFR